MERAVRLANNFRASANYIPHDITWQKIFYEAKKEVLGGQFTLEEYGGVTNFWDRKDGKLILHPHYRP